MWRRVIDCLGVAVRITSEVDELDGMLASVFRTYADAGDQAAVEYALRGRQLIRDGETVRHCRELIDLVAILERDIYREVMARAGGLLLHAGAVVGRGGAALIFAGPSGAGKSTLVRGLLGRGWAYLSEECVALSAGGTCRGLARALHVDDPSLSAPDGYATADYPIRTPGDQVRVTRLFQPPEAAIWRRPARTAAVVAIQHASGAAARLEPLGAGAALARLWPAVFRQEASAIAAAGQVLDGVARYALVTSSPSEAIDHALALAAELDVEPV